MKAFICVLLILACSCNGMKLLYSESFDANMYSNCNFSDYKKYACSTQLNPPLFVRERNLSGNITYVMNNDSSFFYSSSDGTGVISILQGYGLMPMFAIHTTTLYNDKGPTYVVNRDSLEICSRNPVQTSSYRSVFAYVYDQLYLQIDGNVVASLGPFHCRNLRVSENIAGIIHYNENAFISVYDITLEPPLFRQTLSVEGSTFEMCLNHNYLVVGYYYPRFYVFYPSVGKYLYSTSIYIPPGSVMGGCKIYRNQLYIISSSSTRDMVSVYDIVLPFPFIKSKYDIVLNFKGYYRNTITDIENLGNYITISSWGGGDNHEISSYPQFYVYEEREQIFNFTADGSMFFTDIAEYDSEIYFLVGGQKGHAHYPSKGGEFFLFQL